MYTPVLFRDRPRPVQVIIGGVLPAVVGAVAGILIGVSSAAYWVIALLAAVATVVAGFEQLDGWGGADRGFVAGSRTTPPSRDGLLCARGVWQSRRRASRRRAQGSARFSARPILVTSLPAMHALEARRITPVDRLPVRAPRAGSPSRGVGRR